MLKQAHFVLCALILVVFGLTTMTSCTAILGIDTETKDNPCSTPGSVLEPLNCGVGVCHKFVDAQDICKSADGIPITCAQQTDKKQNIDTCLDGLDNDCDGNVDENDSGDCKCDDLDANNHPNEKPCYTGSADVRGKGLCRDGKQPCQNGAWQQCMGDVLPSHEVHDGLDNNCNGEVDEDIPCTNGDDQKCYSGPEGTIGVGTCQRGKQICTNGKWGKCVGEVTPQSETSDDKDHDCDGVKANGFPCSNGMHQDCYTPKKQDPKDKTEGVGPCHMGYFLCVNGKWDTDNCIGEVTPTAEICNNLDDDCDGKVDNATPGSGTECLPDGAPCKQATQCLSTYCVDGFCCHTICNGTCEACSVKNKGSGQDGICGTIPKGADPDDDCPSQDPTSCGTTGVCDGNGSCAKYGTSTVCQSAKCSPDGTALLKASTCNGNGFCDDKMVVSQDCSPFNCDGAAGACRTSCLNDTWCAPGLHCSSASKCVQCNTALDCSGQDTECQTRSCLGGVCGFSYAAAGTPTTNQMPGNCLENQCNGAGLIISSVKDTDVPNDNNQCTDDRCSGGTPSNKNSPAGTMCSEKGGSVCNGFGECVQCVSPSTSTCPGQDTECQTRICTSGVCGVTYTPAGTTTSNQAPGDCRENQCNGSGSIVSAVKDADLPNDNNQCTADTCNSGVPVYANLGPGAVCNQNNGAVCNGLGQCVQCVSPALCPGQDTECQQRTCTGWICGFGFAASGTLVSNQTSGNCQKNQCNGAGGIVSVTDNTDLPNDGNQCTVDTCNNGVPTFNNVAAGTACNQGGGSVCNGVGDCVPCVSASTCPGQDTECQARTCTNWVCGISYRPSGTATLSQAPGDCLENQCNGAGTIVSVIKNSDVPNDGKQCTVDTCASGTPVFPPASSGTPCNQNGGSVCDGAGQCVQCVIASTCPGQDTECQLRTCTSGVCGFSFAMAGTPAMSQMAGDCKKNQCNAVGVIVSVADNTDLPDDSNQCTTDTCNNGAPTFTPAVSGKTCNQTSGHYCDGGGQCVECVSGAQCTSGVCKSNVCQAPSCTDGVKNGSEVEVDCGGGCPCANTVLLLASYTTSNTTNLMGADFHTTQWYATSSIGNGKTSDGLALAIHASTQKGVGMIHQSTMDKLGFTLWTGPNTWSDFATIGSEKSFSAPALSALRPGSLGTYAVYQNSSNASTPTCKTQIFNGTTWTSGSTYNDCKLPQVTVPHFSTFDIEDVAFFTASDLRSFYISAKPIASLSPPTGNGPNESIRPTLITLFNGTTAVEDLVVWVEKTTGNIMFSKSSAPSSSWFTPVQITGVTTTVPVGLATVTDPTGAKKAVVAIQGPGNTLFTSFYDGTNWSAATQVSGVGALTAPAVTHGVGGALAEMAFIDIDGVAYHVRYISGAWTAAVAVGGLGLTNVAIASSP
jgi:Putative metal-binding motif